MLPTTPTSGDEQKTIKNHPTITKKKRTFSNKSGATTDDDIDSILKEMCDLDSPISNKSNKKAPKKPKHHHHHEEKEKEKEEETNLSMPAEETTKDPTITIVAVDRPSSSIASCTDPTIPFYAAYPTSDEAFQTPPKRRLFIFHTVSTMLLLAVTSDQLQPLLRVPSQPTPITKMMIANPPQSLSSEFRPTSGQRANL
jgi:hypothetical protein